MQDFFSIFLKYFFKRGKARSKSLILWDLLKLFINHEIHEKNEKVVFY